MDSLVSKLIKDKHPVEFERRTDSLIDLRDRINNGFVFIKFTKTQGGTELGINLDKALCELSNIEGENGTITIVGTCELNFHKVRCYAEIDLKTREGLGHLELIDDTIGSANASIN